MKFWYSVARQTHDGPRCFAFGGAIFLHFMGISRIFAPRFWKVRGERSSTVEHQAVALGVVGSNPIAHP